MLRGMVGTVLLVAFVLTQVSGAEAQTGGKKSRAPYVHTVILYLKSDAPKEAAGEMIRDAHELLAKIPSVRSVRAGRPTEKATSKVVVTDYQVGLLVLFADYEGLETYQKHPLHLQFVDRHKKHIERVQVYDFQNQAE